LIGELLEAGALCDFDAIPRLVADYAARDGLTNVRIYLADRQQLVLRPVPLNPDVLGEQELGIDSTLAGLAFRNVEVIGSQRSPEEEAEAGPRRLWLPLLDGTERLGVLEVHVPDLDDKTMTEVRRLAVVVSMFIVSKRNHSDTYARIMRTRPMTLAAEVQWNLLPPLSFANERVVVGAALEPAYEVAGDAFDYALSGGSIYLSIFDAMGHDTAAGLTASIAIGSWRNNRRHAMGLAGISKAINDDIAEQFGGTRFVTGVMASLDLVTGGLTWVNRGHPPPLVIRGGRWVTSLEREAAIPMGFRLPEEPEEYRFQLEPGDRLLLYTDGIPEARDVQGRMFGVERFLDHIIKQESTGLAAPETLRRLIRSVLDYQGGHLQDDAAVLLAEWRGFAGDVTPPGFRQ
jgi:serine phosphatase RsbU (regulator of sigma subunit)